MMDKIHIHTGGNGNYGCISPLFDEFDADMKVVEKLASEVSGIIVSQFKQIYTLYSLTKFWRVEE